ncbi:MAG: RNA polymerase sigma factor, partial [Planctomycetota bacterium]
GQKDAFEELVRDWQMRLFYYIRRLVDDEQTAWQLLQETWVKVLPGVKKLREARKLPAWLYSIARKTAISHLRAEYRKQALFDAGGTAADIEQDNCEFSLEDAEQVHYALGRISLPHREILTLFFLQDLSLEEIAGVLRIPRGTVKSRLHYARRALRAVLEKEEKRYE